MNVNRYRRIHAVLIAAVLAVAFCHGVSSRAADLPDDQVAKIKQALPGEPFAEPAQERKILIFTLCKGFTHNSIPACTAALKMMGQQTGAYTADVSDDMSVFSEENLAQYDAVVLNNTTRLGFEKQERRDALMDFVKEDGKGLIGFHAAADNFYEWEEGQKLMGGLFSGHPWGGGGTWAVKLDDPDHPLVKPFSGPFLVNDEIYLFKRGIYSRQRSRVLLSLDMENPRNDVGDKGRQDNDHAVSWIHSAGNGRVFYCGLGHHRHLFWTPSVLKHSLAGIQYALGDLEVDDTPSAELSGMAEPQHTVSDAQPFEGIIDWQYGDSGEKLANIRSQVRNATDEDKQGLEKRLVATLEYVRSSDACRQFCCRMLRRIGNCYSVPALAHFLDEPEMSHMARFALQRMPCAQVDDVLRAALDRVSGNLKVGVISSLGARGDQDAIPRLAELLSDGNDAVVHATIDALARIGGEQAEETLAGADVPDSLEDDRQQARVACADAMLTGGQQEQARRVYRELYEDSNVATVRGASLRGLVRSGAEDAADLLFNALESDSAYMRRAAAKHLHRIEGAEVSRALAEQLQGLDAETKVMVISALADRGDKVAAPHVAEALDSQNTEVRRAALDALSSLGNAEHVLPLARVAAGSGQDADIAYQSLVKLRGAVVDEKVTDLLGASDSDVGVRQVLARLAASRGNTGAVPALMDMAQADDTGLRRRAMQSLAELAQAEDASKLVNLLVETRAEAAEEAVVAACRKIEGEAERIEPVLAGLDQAENAAARASLVRVLGQLQGDAALEAIYGVLDSDNDDVRRAAVNALAGWSSFEPAGELLRVARDVPEAATGILALRGYINLIGQAEQLSAAEKLEHYEKAMEAADRASERKRVLSGVARLGTSGALNFIGEYLHEDNVRGEAQTAYLQVAKEVALTAPEQAREALKRLADEAANESIAQQAQDALDNLHQHDGYILAWRLSGPYNKDGAGGAELFDIAFAPEKNADADWRYVRGGESAPWMVDLERIIGGDNRVAYLRTGIQSPEQRNARLELGSDDGIKAWLNGELVHANNASRAVGKAQDVVEVELEEGWNELMLKITERSADWAASARFTSQEGQPLEDLQIDPSK